MTQVVVVESDKALRGMLHNLLATDGQYAVTEFSEDAAALAYLAAAPEGMLAMCGNRNADHHLTAAFFAVVSAGERLSTRHQYLFLSTNATGIPPGPTTVYAALVCSVQRFSGYRPSLAERPPRARNCARKRKPTRTRSGGPLA